MLIELKDFQFYPELTDETNAFSAKLLVNKQEAAHCVNRGNAETEIRIIDKNTYALYREYIKKASEEFSEVVKGGLVTEAGYVETLASGYIYKEYAKKKKAKIRSLCRYSIVYADRKHSMNLRQISFYSDSEAEKKNLSSSY